MNPEEAYLNPPEPKKTMYQVLSRRSPRDFWEVEESFELYAEAADLQVELQEEELEAKIVNDDGEEV